MLGHGGQQQELGRLEHGGNKSIHHQFQLPTAAAASSYASFAFPVDERSNSYSMSISSTCPSQPQRYAWTPPSNPNDVQSLGVIAASTDNNIYAGGFGDDYILEQSIKVMCPGLPHVLPASVPTKSPLEMLSSVSSEVAEVTQKSTAENHETRSGWLPILISSSSPSQSKAVAVINDEDHSYKGERHPTTNLRHGFGIMSYPNGSVYTGAFENDKRHGFGKCWYPEGLGVYTGFWANGKRNGLGKMVYSNGEVYHGEWLSDLPYPTKAR